MASEIDEVRCRNLGLDPLRVKSVARRISAAVQEANRMGLVLFGGSGTGDLRVSGGSRGVVAVLEGRFDGGDGGDDF